MKGSEELPLEKLLNVLLGPEALNLPSVVNHLWKLPLADDHLIFWTLKILTLLSVEPLSEDRTHQELQRSALRAHQEARQAADLRHEMARRTMPSDDLTNQVKRSLSGILNLMLVL